MSDENSRSRRQVLKRSGALIAGTALFTSKASAAPFDYPFSDEGEATETTPSGETVHLSASVDGLLESWNQYTYHLDTDIDTSLIYTNEPDYAEIRSELTIDGLDFSLSIPPAVSASVDQDTADLTSEWSDPPSGDYSLPILGSVSGGTVSQNLSNIEGETNHVNTIDVTVYGKVRYGSHEEVVNVHLSDRPTLDTPW